MTKDGEKESKYDLEYKKTIQCSGKRYKKLQQKLEKGSVLCHLFVPSFGSGSVKEVGFEPHRIIFKGQ
jgi:hypothetical protein